MNIYFYFPLLFLMNYGYFTIIKFPYDRKIMSNIIVRGAHSTGCIYSIAPILMKYNFHLIDFHEIPIPEIVIYIYNRSISFFIWDCFALLISNEKEKLTFISHHLIASISISIILYNQINWYLICVALFVAEITNPLTQISEFCELIQYENLMIEKTYLYSMFFIRGFIFPTLLLLFTKDIFLNYDRLDQLSDLHKMSLMIIYCSCFLITIASVNWIYKKYLLIYNINDKKMSYM